MDNGERRLIQRCQQGDRDAYKQLFLTQEVFLRVFENISQFRFNSNFATWLYRIAVNMCFDERRKRQKRDANANELTERYEQTRSSVNTPADELLKKEGQIQVQQALANVKDAHRTILVLREISTKTKLISVMRMSPPRDDATENVAACLSKKHFCRFCRLSKRHRKRKIILLHYLVGLSYDELAKVLKCSTGRVKSRLHEARLELRRVAS